MAGFAHELDVEAGAEKIAENDLACRTHEGGKVRQVVLELFPATV